MTLRSPYSDEHSGKVKSFMLDVLCPLINESDVVSNDLLDIILLNVVEPAKSQRRNAYQIAKELIIKCSDTLEPYIQAVSGQYRCMFLRCDVCCVIFKLWVDGNLTTPLFKLIV